MGGNAIKNSVPVQARNARKIALSISESLQNYFNVPTTILGSVMKICIVVILILQYNYHGLMIM